MRRGIITLVSLLATFTRASGGPSGIQVSLLSVHHNLYLVDFENYPEHSVCDVDTASARSESTWIGKESNVEVYTVSCPTATRHVAREPEDLNPRQTTTPTNVCGAQCKQDLLKL